MSNMQATGVPPHVVVANEVRDLKDQLGTLKGDLSGTEGRLAQQMVEFEERNKAEVESLKEQNNLIAATLPKMCVGELMDKFRVEGMHPVSRVDFEELRKQQEDIMQSAVSQLNDLIQSQFHKMNAPAPPPPAAPAAQSAPALLSNAADPYPLYMWKGEWVWLWHALPLT